jgi:Na+-translocating ferredoxin:NAD+ oxidoreductase RnfC subunit|tara:strand:+ start:653 stop:760 length:108 start_codon:yes stop_codon:yes gene_type:complete
MYKEQREPCQQCHQMLEIIPANGVNDQINLIVSEA